MEWRSPTCGEDRAAQIKRGRERAHRPCMPELPDKYIFHICPQISIPTTFENPN